MKNFNMLLVLVSLMVGTAANAQRYLKPTFDVNPSKTIVYGKNYTVLAVPSLGKTVPQPLAAELFTPKGDTETKRPLVIYLHTGSFLPTPQNGSPSGSFKDSTAVEICTRFAKLGYVAVSADYRLGWAATAQTQEVRANSLINAAYRGVHDGRTCVRFFKENAAVYGIDTTKIMVFGQGTGGYISLGMASLDKYLEVVETTNPANKFKGTNGLPYVIEKIPDPTSPTGVYYVSGDVNGLNLGRVPVGVVGPPKGGDTLNLPNWTKHKSTFNMTVNLGGAVGDISWIDAATTPIISFHCPYDLFAPYKSAVLNVNLPDGTALPIIEVQGAYEISKKLNALKVNDVFKPVTAFDPYGATAKARNEGFEGLFPLYGTDGVLDSSPWDFWAATNTNNANGLKTNKTMSGIKARKTIDTIVGYVLPRACLQMKLPCASLVADDNITDNDVKLAYAPNPASTEVRFTAATETPIKELYIYDINGRMVRVDAAINSSEYTMPRGSIASGIYMVQLRFEKGFITKRVIFE